VKDLDLADAASTEKIRAQGLTLLNMMEYHLVMT